jgi:hypothetical protein
LVVKPQIINRFNLKKLFLLITNTSSDYKIMKENLPFRFGSEVYTWFMSGNGQTHQGRLAHMIEVIAKSGFTGIQPIFTWMGDLVDADRLEAKLKEQGIELAALALALEWNGADESENEKETDESEDDEDESENDDSEDDDDDQEDDDDIEEEPEPEPEPEPATKVITLLDKKNLIKERLKNNMGKKYDSFF